MIVNAHHWRAVASGAIGQDRSWWQCSAAGIEGCELCEGGYGSKPLFIHPVAAAHIQALRSNDSSGSSIDARERAMITSSAFSKRAW